MNAVQTQITVQMHQQEGAQTPWKVFFVRVTQDTQEMESHVLVGIQPTSFLTLEKVLSGTFGVYFYLLRKNVHFLPSLIDICYYCSKFKLFLIFLLDINECLIDPCHVNGICNNTNGGFNCICRTGFSGNGFQCIGKLIISKQSPFLSAFNIWSQSWQITQ